jgi:hypothetical protein
MDPGLQPNPQHSGNAISASNAILIVDHGRVHGNIFIYFFLRIVLELFGLIALFGPARLALFCREADEDGSRS